MVEDIQVIVALELDGRAVSFGHGVLVRSAARPGEEWDVFLLGVTRRSLRLIGSESQAAIVTHAGRRLAGPVGNDPADRRADYARLVSRGELVAA